MSEFTAKIRAELDTSKFEQQMRQVTGNQHRMKIDLETSGTQQGLNQINNSMRNTAKQANTLGDTMKKSLRIGAAATVTAKGFQLIENAAKDAVEAVGGFDTAIKNLRMATNGSYEDTAALVRGYNALGKNIGATTTEVSNSANAWLRQGNSIKDTNILIRDSMVLSKVAQLDSADSTKYLTSAMKGYKVAAEDVSKIVDKLTAVDLVSATDAGGLAEAMSRVANTANDAGVSMDKLLGYLAVTGEVTQKSMSSIGESYKTIFTRMSNIKAGALEYIDEDGTTETLSDVETVLNNLGIALRSSDNEFRNFGDVLDEVAANWNNYSSVQQAAISKAFAGTRQQENFRVLMANYEQASSYMEVAANSAGTAEQKFSAYLDSIEAKTKSLQAAFESLATNTISTEMVGDIIDAGTAVLEFVDDTNLLQGALAGLATVGVVKAFSAITTGVMDAATKLTEFNNALSLISMGNLGTQEIEQLAAMTANLSQSQLKAVLSSEALSTEQRIAILTTQGMTTAQAEATLASMGLATAEGAATTTTVTLSGAFKGLWATLMANPLVLIATGVAAAVVAIGKLADMQKEAAESAKEMADSMREEAQEAAEEVKTLDELIDKYKELAKSDNQDSGTRAEIRDIQSQITDLVGSQADNLDLVNGKLDEELAKLNEIEKKEAQKAAEKAVGNYKAAVEESDTAIASDSFLFVNDYVYTGKREKELEKILKDGGYGNNVQSGGFFGNTLFVMDEYDNDMKKLENAEEKAEYLRGMLEYIEKNYEDYSSSKMYSAISSQISAYDEITQKQKEAAETLLSTVASEEKYNDKLNGLVVDSADSYEQYRQTLIDTISESDRIKYAMENGDIDNSDIEEYVNNYMASLDSFSAYYNAWSKKFSEDSVDTLEDKVTKIKDAFAKVYDDAQSFTLADIEYTNLVTWLNGLDDSEKEIIYKISVENDTTGWNITDWQEQLEYYSSGLKEAEDSLQSFYDLLLDDSENNFSDTISNYTDTLDTLKDALDDFNNGSLTDSQIVELMKQFPELTNYADDLGNGIESTMKSIIGSSDDAASMLGVFDAQIQALGEDSAGADALRTLRDEMLKLYDTASDGFTFSIDAEVSHMDNLYSAIEESVSSTGLSTQGINAIKAMYSDLEGYDASKLFEKTTNGIHLNVQALRELEKEYENAKNQDFKNELQKLADQYNDVTEKINTCSDAAELADLYKQRDDIADQIEDVSTLAAQYEGLTSAFHKWEEAQSTPDEDDMFTTLSKGLEDIKELYESGRIGVDDFREAVQLMSDTDLSTASVEELMGVYDKGYATMQKFFTGNQDGLIEFLNTAKSVSDELGQTWVQLDENGNYTFDFGVGGDEALAKAINEMTDLQMSTEEVQILLRAMSAYGYDINLDSMYTSLGLLETDAESANEKLKELGKTDIQFYFDSTNINTITEQIGQAQEILNQFRNSDGSVDLTIEGAEEAQTVLVALIAQKQSLNAPAVMNVDTTQAASDIGSVIGLLQDFQTNYNDIEIETAVGADTTEAQTNIQTVLQSINDMPDSVKTSLGLDDSEFQSALETLTSTNIDVKAGVNLDTTALNTIQSTIAGIDADIMVKAGVDASLIEGYEPQDKESTVTYIVDDKAVKDYDVPVKEGVVKYQPKLNNWTVPTLYGTIVYTKKVTGNSNATGTAHAKGTAFSRGTWGTKDNGTALGGELGQELVVRDGRYFTIGDSGAEFFKYKKNDIIFNARQTQEILSKGKINGRGKALAEGTAFSSGSGTFYKGGKVNVGGVSGGGDKSGKNSNSSDKKDDKQTKNWIEVAISRAERAINNLDKTVKNVYKTFAKRNSAITKEISKITSEISLQKKAYDRYMKEANSVGLSKDLKKKVKNGTIDIKEYDSDTAEKIEEYQKWYEAALDCKDAIDDLQESISELYKEKFDNIVTEWTNKVQDLEHIAERTSSLISRRSDYASDYVTPDKSTAASNANIADYQGLVKNAQEQIGIKTAELAALKSELDTAVSNGSIEYRSEAYYEMLGSIQAVENEVDSLNSDIISYSNAISEEYMNIFNGISQQYENKMSLAESLYSEYQTMLNKAEAMGYAASGKYYEMLKEQQESTLDSLKSEQKALSDALYSAVASGEIEYGSNAWYEMSQEICNVTNQIHEAELAVIELDNSIRQIQWDNFDYLEDTISKLKDESDFLIDLLSSSNLYEDNGQLTDAGVSTMGLHGVNYNVLMSQADDYAAEILSLNKQIASDPANTTLIDRRNELLSIQRQCIQAAEDEKAAIKDLVSDGISKELSSLKELIGKYTDALDSQKDLYSFQKKVEKQTKNIATLQKQLSAYQNDVTEETKAKIQKIKVDLEEAKDDLEETQYEQYISDQKKLLDELYVEYERILNERLDNIDALIEDMIAMVNGSAITINDTLNAAASSVGYTMTTEMSNLWSNAANELAQSRAEQLANVTALINQMVANGAISQENANSILAALGSGSAQEIQNALNIISKLQENGELDTTNANSLISALNTQGTNYTGVITTYGTDFSNKQTVTNNTLDGIKNTVNSILTAANTQAELVKQQVDAEKAAAASAAAAAQSAAQAAANSTKTAAAAAATSSTPTTTSSNTGQEKKTSSTSTQKKNTTTTTKKTTTQGDGKIQVGDKVTFKSGKYYCDSYGGKPTGSKNVGKTVYVTKINKKGSKPYHISTGSKLGSGDLGWLTKSQISGYMSGAKEINRDELAWTNENYDKIGGETIIRKSDHAVLSTLSKGSRVYNALASDNIWKMANNPGSFIMDNLLGNGSIDTSSISSGGNNDIEQNIDLDINIDNVEDLDDLLNQMKKSKDFEKLIQAIAVAPLTGTSVNKKNRFNF